MAFRPFSLHFSPFRAWVLSASLLPALLPADDADKERKQTEEIVRQLVEDSQKHNKERVMKEEDALHQAELACVMLATDVSSYTDHLGEVQTACLKAGRIEDARLLAAKMSELGNDSGISSLLVAHARDGRTKEAWETLEQLKKNMPRLTTHRRQMAARQLTLSLGLLMDGEPDISRMQDHVTAQDLLPEHLLEIEAEWIQSGRKPTPKTVAEVLARIQKTPVSPLAGGCYAIACADRLLADTKTRAEGAATVVQAGKICLETPHVTAHRLLLDLARVAWRHEARDDARKAMSLFLKLCAGYAAKAEWKAGYLADAAVLLHEWQETELASKAMIDAREALKTVFVADVGRELVATARAAHLLGQHDQRDRAALDALRSATVHPHPRVRGDAAVAVCLLYASLNELLPPPVREALRKLHSGEPASP
jgi:hypothetical protein